MSSRAFKLLSSSLILSYGLLHSLSSSPAFLSVSVSELRIILLLCEWHLSVHEITKSNITLDWKCFKAYFLKLMATVLMTLLVINVSVSVKMWGNKYTASFVLQIEQVLENESAWEGNLAPLCEFMHKKSYITNIMHSYWV